MKRMIVVAAVMALAVACGNVAGAAEHARGGLGFRANGTGARNASELRIDAPIGVRWWLSNQKVAIDLGFGYSSHKDVSANERATDYSIEVGIPFAVKTWDRVHVIARPGFNYASQQDFIAVVSIGPPFEKITDKFTTVTGEIEAEVFLVDNVSVSASEGIGFVDYSPGEAGEPSSSDFTTFGRNFTQVGFHVYFLGSK